MPAITKTIKVSTQGNNDILDLTLRVKEALAGSKIKDGLATVFAVGSTLGVTTMEYEPGQISDLKELLEMLVPKGKDWKHNYSWGGGDGNAHSHLRASLIGPSLTVPIVKGELALGTWQQIVLIDFDNRSREREIIVQIVGEYEQNHL